VTMDGRPFELPIIPGHEVSGVIEELGPDIPERFDSMRVYGLIGLARDGANAEEPKSAVRRPPAYWRDDAYTDRESALGLWPVRALRTRRSIRASAHTWGLRCL
jgi:NADPH:quinone reductase-like Zn-dependent oxidoreductase